MRAVIQRVTEAKVVINGAIRSAIGPGMVILLGIEEADNMDDIVWLSGKISRMRIFDDQNAVMNLSIKETGADVMVVSQFTLYASTRKGNRPSYIRAAHPDIAIPLYEQFIRQLESDIEKKTGTGEFGAMMQVHLVNDGPVTIIIDSKSRE